MSHVNFRWALPHLAKLSAGKRVHGTVFVVLVCLSHCRYTVNHVPHPRALFCRHSSGGMDCPIL